MPLFLVDWVSSPRTAGSMRSAGNDASNGDSERRGVAAAHPSSVGCQCFGYSGACKLAGPLPPGVASRYQPDCAAVEEALTEARALSLSSANSNSTPIPTLSDEKEKEGDAEARRGTASVPLGLEEQEQFDSVSRFRLHYITGGGTRHSIVHCCQAQLCVSRLLLLGPSFVLRTSGSRSELAAVFRGLRPGVRIAGGGSRMWRQRRRSSMLRFIFFVSLQVFLVSLLPLNFPPRGHTGAFRG